MRTLIIIVSVTLCMNLGGLTVILVVDVVSEIREFSVYYAEFSCKRSVALWLFFFIQTWSLFQNILLQRYTFFLLLEFLMKKLNCYSLSYFIR